MCAPSQLTEKQKEFTCSELSKFDGVQGRPNFVAIRGVVYDITAFVKRHPGGETMLHIAAGRDITPLFESYHLSSDEIQKHILPKLRVGVLTTTEHPVYGDMSPFHVALKQRVLNYLQSSDYDIQHTSLIQAVRVFVILSLIVLTYSFSHFATDDTPFYILCISAILQGIARALMGLHLMHDASHGSLTKFPKIHLLFGFVGNDLLNGTSFYAWLHQHVLGHHNYPNMLDIDPDIEPLPLRMHPEHPWHPIHKTQWIWGPLLYGLLSYSHRFRDIAFLMERKWGSIRMAPPRRSDLFLFWLGKLAFCAHQFVLPWILGVSHHIFILAHLLSELAGSFYLAIAFQANHVAQETAMISCNEESQSWAEMQARTTQDYGAGGLSFLLTGGLNLQVVHHLLPGVSQLHYPRLQPIVRQSLKEYGILYNHKQSFSAALASHIAHLRKMGDR